MVYKTKAVVCLIGVLIALILMPVGCLHYEMNYKKTIRDKSLSADMQSKSNVSENISEE